MSDVPVEKLRALCSALPEVEERLSHGSNTWFIRGKKTFVMFVGFHHGDPNLAFWCAAGDGVQADLISENPEYFFRPPYVGHRGWVGVRLDTGIGWDEIGELVEDAYRAVAPARLIAVLGG
ncbi:predicted DNA-binding protein (MmcQ/YjbR family) [Jatrophihabitans sp. GAS493]|uniref:MmcQ/YjbR family DNA-binding protein n=1 Tax=Jatrophihabitans sp. GAS493 TaxID=1907575 RepID=UPI000BB8DEE0|nr:MmcQ/YjbR family DNA-binding protein [Jatrophihabitans sp. GAS493]SOD73909.1 predicted DNA-binding protein (MmcQ/YjbR family) [Jatrophihabitans sp. GAS493]